MRETAQAQSDLVLGTVQDKGSAEQAILDVRQTLAAVSADPEPFPRVCFGSVVKTQRDTFNVTQFSKGQKPTQAPWRQARTVSCFLPQGSLA